MGQNVDQSMDSPKAPFMTDPSVAVFVARAGPKMAWTKSWLMAGNRPMLIDMRSYLVCNSATWRIGRSVKFLAIRMAPA